MFFIGIDGFMNIHLKHSWKRFVSQKVLSGKGSLDQWFSNFFKSDPMFFFLNWCVYIYIKNQITQSLGF